MVVPCLPSRSLKSRSREAWVCVGSRLRGGSCRTGQVRATACDTAVDKWAGVKVPDMEERQRLVLEESVFQRRGGQEACNCSGAPPGESSFRCDSTESSAQGRCSVREMLGSQSRRGELARSPWAGSLCWAPLPRWTSPSQSVTCSC